MYILKVIYKKDKSLNFQKEYKNFQDLMKKFNEIDFEKEKCLYNIYKSMNISEILHDYLGSNSDLETIKNELKDIIEDL